MSIICDLTPQFCRIYLNQWSHRSIRTNVTVFKTYNPLLESKNPIWLSAKNIKHWVSFCQVFLCSTKNFSNYFKLGNFPQLFLRPDANQNTSHRKPNTPENIDPTPRNSTESLQLTLLLVCLSWPVARCKQVPNGDHEAGFWFLRRENCHKDSDHGSNEAVIIQQYSFGAQNMCLKTNEWFLQERNETFVRLATLTKNY